MTFLMPLAKSLSKEYEGSGIKLTCGIISLNLIQDRLTIKLNVVAHFRVENDVQQAPVSYSEAICVAYIC
jgi:hypothetical protein